jgi:hypothetical protein
VLWKLGAMIQEWRKTGERHAQATCYEPSRFGWGHDDQFYPGGVTAPEYSRRGPA